MAVRIDELYDRGNGEYSKHEKSPSKERENDQWIASRRTDGLLSCQVAGWRTRQLSNQATQQPMSLGVNGCVFFRLGLIDSEVLAIDAASIETGDGRAALIGSGELDDLVQTD